MLTNISGNKPRIAFVSPHDFQGGASRIGHYLFEGFRKEGYETAFFVGRRSLEDPDVHHIRKYKNSGQKLWSKFQRRITWELGHENFYYPGSTDQILDWNPDIIHFHNPQGGYFDLRKLENLSANIPVIFTLHDPWMFTGHCSYFIHCQKWLDGCGSCPDLNRRPSLKRDGTAFNFKRKQGIYKNSQFYVATPSAWLLKEAEKSMLKESIVAGRVINNGVNEEVFTPKDSSVLRNSLNIPEKEIVLLYVVNSQMQTNPYKDFTTISNALEQLRLRKKEGQKLTFIALGADGESYEKEGIRVIYAGFQSDMNVISSYFNVADLYLHAARAENYPNVVMEALACGTPCIVTNTGGVPEQIVEDVTGWVVPFEGFSDMTDKILELSENPEKIKKASIEARKWIEEKHTLSHMINDYRDFYELILKEKYN
jgi:glycosyltransferase involved in cell wall biosynthesis